VISPGLLTQVHTYINNSSVLPDDILAELRTDATKDSARYRFTRNLALYVALWNEDSHPRFAEDYPEEHAAFEKTMVSFFAQSAGFFALTRQLSSQQPLDPVPEPIKNARAGYRSLCLEVYEEIRLMLARVMLYSSKGQHEVGRRLAGLGFMIQCPNRIRISPNLLVLNGIGVISLFLAATLLAAGSGMSIGPVLVIGCLVAVNHSIAAIAAVVPKQLWGFADIRSSVERPILAYAVSALCTFTVCFPLSLGFWLLRPQLSLPEIPFSAQCKWLLLPVVTAAVLAFECDDYIAKKATVWLRWVEGAALAVIMAVAGFVVVRWIYEPLGTGPIPPRVLLPILLSAAMGFLFGATIPNGYRKTLRQAADADAVPCGGPPLPILSEGTTAPDPVTPPDARAKDSKPALVQAA
jgi:hypothetical protein